MRLDLDRSTLCRRTLQNVINCKLTDNWFHPFSPAAAACYLQPNESVHVIFVCRRKGRDLELTLLDTSTGPFNYEGFRGGLTEAARVAVGKVLDKIPDTLSAFPPFAAFLDDHALVVEIGSGARHEPQVSAWIPEVALNSRRVCDCAHSHLQPPGARVINSQHWAGPTFRMDCESHDLLHTGCQSQEDLRQTLIRSLHQMAT